MRQQLQHQHCKDTPGNYCLACCTAASQANCAELLSCPRPSLCKDDRSLQGELG
jgi:hypothetical protein